MNKITRQTVRINASSVAACIGKNPYKSRTDMIISTLQQFAPTSTIASQRTKEQLQQDALTSASSETRHMILDAIADAKLTPTTSESTQTAITTVCDAVHDDSLSADELELLKEYVTSRLSTQHGVRKENDTIVQHKQTWMDTHASVVTKDTRTHRIVVDVRDDIEYVVVGKIDSIETLPNGDQVLVEVKNRIKTLFFELRDYERIQVHTYLHMLSNMVSAKLVEQYNNKIHVIPIDRDDAVWNEEILPGLLSFIDEVHQGMTETTKEMLTTEDVVPASKVINPESGRLIRLDGPKHRELVKRGVFSA